MSTDEKDKYLGQVVRQHTEAERNLSFLHEKANHFRLCLHKAAEHISEMVPRVVHFGTGRPSLGINIDEALRDLPTGTQIDQLRQEIKYAEAALQGLERRKRELGG